MADNLIGGANQQDVHSDVAGQLGHKLSDLVLVLLFLSSSTVVRFGEACFSVFLRL